MSSHQKDILSIMLFPIILLFLGLGIGWVLVGSAIWEIFRLLKFQLVFMSIVMCLMGLGLCKYEIDISLFVKKYSKGVFDSARAFNNKELIRSLGVFLIISCLCGLIGGVSRQAILETAMMMIIGGIILSIPIIMMFICATIGRMK